MECEYLLRNDSVDIPVFKVSKRKKTHYQIAANDPNLSFVFCISSKFGSIRFRVLFEPESLMQSPDLIDDLVEHAHFRTNCYSSSVEYYNFDVLDASSCLPASSIQVNDDANVSTFKSVVIEMMPTTKLPSNKMTIRGKFCVGSRGVYHLIFDNSFSFHKSKLVKFSYWMASSTAAITKKVENLTLESSKSLMAASLLLGDSYGWIYIRDSYYKHSSSIAKKAFRKRWILLLHETAELLVFDNFLIERDPRRVKLINFSILVDIPKLEIVLNIYNTLSCVEIPSFLRHCCRKVKLRTKRLAELKFWQEMFSSVKKNIIYQSQNAASQTISLSEDKLIANLVELPDASSEAAATNTPELEMIGTPQQLAGPDSDEDASYSSSSEETFYDAFEASAEKSIADQERTNLSISSPFRTKLPAGMAPYNVKLSDLIMKGKGSVPISLNEPITLLQKLCEDLEYASIIFSNITSTSNMDEDFLKVCGFALSIYAGSAYRERKPFNPLLGETFEYKTDKWKFFAEKVSHDPLIVASHTSSEEFEYWNSLEIVSHFKGLSVEVCFAGKNYFRLIKSNRLFVWNRANTLIRGGLSSSNGKMAEIVGEVFIKEITPARDDNLLIAKVKFKSSSFFSTSPVSAITGSIYKANERSSSNVPPVKCGEISGNWNGQIFVRDFDDETESLNCIFTANQLPINHKDNYGFTSFAINLKGFLQK